MGPGVGQEVGDKQAEKTPMERVGGARQCHLQEAIDREDGLKSKTHLEGSLEKKKKN